MDDTGTGGSDRLDRTRFAAAAMPSTAGAAELATPGLELVFEATITLGAPLDLGHVGDVHRRFVPITGGAFAGPKIAGIVLPGGGDRQEIGADGVSVIHARYMLRAADGTVIGIENPGVRVASPDVTARLGRGEDLDPGQYYFRTTPRFDVPPGPHDWLRRSVFVGQGIRHPASVVLRVFRVS